MCWSLIEAVYIEVSVRSNLSCWLYNHTHLIKRTNIFLCFIKTKYNNLIYRNHNNAYGIFFFFKKQVHLFFLINKIYIRIFIKHKLKLSRSVGH
jgi:hypothetical protein